MSSSISTLYSNLKKDSRKSLSTLEKEEFINKVSALDEKGIEIIYVIIKMCEMENNLKQTEVKISDKELKFDLDKLPDMLQNMLYKFVKIHISTMEEENTISIQRLKL